MLPSDGADKFLGEYRPSSNRLHPPICWLVLASDIDTHISQHGQRLKIIVEVIIGRHVPEKPVEKFV
jgi:hypothetical protein